MEIVAVKVIEDAGGPIEELALRVLGVGPNTGSGRVGASEVVSVLRVSVVIVSAGIAGSVPPTPRLVEVADAELVMNVGITDPVVVVHTVAKIKDCVVFRHIIAPDGEVLFQLGISVLVRV